jgi:hypothetical protein
LNRKKDFMMIANQVDKTAGFRSITVEADARSLDKWRKQVIGGQPETGRKYAITSDEGSYMPGGEGTAPSPLTYFVSGMAL